MTRTSTPDRTNADGSTTITMQRACNGCGQALGDVTDIEVDRAIAGLPPLDVRAECGHCHPLVELEAQGCRTWELTRRSFSQVAHEIDQLKPWVFSKGYWQEVDGELQVVGLRVGTGEKRVVALYGDWLIRHPDGTFSVRKAPEAVTAPQRIQRRRTKGWRLPDNAVIVSRPSRFGNPFTIKDAIEAEWSNPHSVCAEMYGEWLRVGTEGGWFNETYRIGKQVFDRRRILADLHQLRGKDLACTCPLPEPGQPDHCHAAVLLKLANGAAR